MSVDAAKDVVVIGGGPAGSSAAFALARAGLRVAVLERTTFDERRIGELVAPEIAGALQSMNVWTRFRADAHLPVQGIVTCWGGDEPQVNDFLGSPFGVGWVVDRRRFDRLLLDAAADAGADIYLGARARRCHRDGAGWTVAASQNDRAFRIRARLIVDATGRARGVRAGARAPTNRLTACVCYVEQARGSGDRALPVLESTKDGWWFSAPLPDGDCVVAFFTDADLLPSNRSLLCSRFWQLLEETTLIREHVPKVPARLTFHRCAADAQWRPDTEPGRIAVGDGLLAMDPLSGRGVCAAIESGRLGAGVLAASQSEGDAALTAWNIAQERRFADHLAEQTQHYQSEHRWPESPFWCRRHGPAYAPSPRR